MRDTGCGRSRLWLALVMAVALGQACSNQTDTKAPTYPADQTGTSDSVTQTRVQVAVNPNTVELGRRAGLTVLVTNLNGRPLEGRHVQLSTTLGRIDVVDGFTDPAGKFVTSIYGPCEGGPGSATVTAFVEGASGSTVVTFTPATPGGPCPYGASLFRAPRSMYAMASLALVLGLVGTQLAGGGWFGRRRAP